MAGSTQFRYFAAWTQGKHDSTRLKHFKAQLLRLRLRLPGLCAWCHGLVVAVWNGISPVPTRWLQAISAQLCWSGHGKFRCSGQQKVQTQHVACRHFATSCRLQWRQVADQRISANFSRWDDESPRRLLSHVSDAAPQYRCGNAICVTGNAPFSITLNNGNN